MLQTRGRSAGSNTREKNKKSTTMMKTLSTPEKKEEVGTLFCLFFCSMTKQKRLFVFHAFPFFSWGGRRPGENEAFSLMPFFRFLAQQERRFGVLHSVSLSRFLRILRKYASSLTHSLARSRARAETFHFNRIRRRRRRRRRERRRR